MRPQLGDGSRSPRRSDRRLLFSLIPPCGAKCPQFARVLTQLICACTAPVTQDKYANSVPMVGIERGRSSRTIRPYRLRLRAYFRASEREQPDIARHPSGATCGATEAVFIASEALRDIEKARRCREQAMRCIFLHGILDHPTNPGMRKAARQRKCRAALKSNAFRSRSA